MSLVAFSKWEPHSNIPIPEQRPKLWRGIGVPLPPVTAGLIIWFPISA